MSMRGLFKKKKIEKEDVTLCPGVHLVADVKMGDMTPGQDALVKGLSEALIMFGAMGGFLSCLEVNYYVGAVALAYLAAAAYFSYLFKSGKLWVRDLGYLAFFAIYSFGVISCRWYINSGFYALINLYYEEASKYFDMDAVRDFQEVIADRRLTVTMAAIFIGVAVIVILNIYLSTYMSILAAVIVSIPMFVFPLFFRKEPDSFYVMLLLAGLASVIAQKGNGHYRRNKAQTQFEVEQKKRTHISYSQSGRAVFQMILAFTCLSVLVISVANIVYPKDRFFYRFKNSSLKASMEDTVENVMLTGISSLFNFYDSTGGMSGGQLGGISSVRSDYQPDLEVTFAPYSYDRIYLRGFVGEHYDTDHWSKDDAGLMQSAVAGSAKGRMDIQNVGASDHYLYMPYYTELAGDTAERYTYEDGIARWQTQSYTYYPEVSVQKEDGSYTRSDISFQGQEDVKDSYLEVPDANLDTIRTFCEKLGVTDSDSDQQIIHKLILYFQEHIPYTLRPGSMPRGADFVNYFLEKNKKGFCAHFASAATLIFRYYGIPARYVEGYAIDYSQVMDADLVEDQNYEDYYVGDAPLGKTAVVKVSARDADAHAWVEVYLDGKWQIAEVTPASDEQDIDDFWSVFGNMISGGDRQRDAVNAVSIGQGFSMDRMKWVFIVIIGVFAVFVLFRVTRIAVRKAIRIAGYHSRDERGNIIAYYRYMCDCLRILNAEFQYADSHEAQLAYMLPEAPQEKRQQLAVQMERLSYSMGALEPADRTLLAALKAIWSACRKRYPFKDRLRLFMRM